MFLKKQSVLFIFLLYICNFSTLIFAQQKIQKLNDDSPLHFNQWELLIYRPENSGTMNNIRCWLKLEDENGNDVTYSKCKATYYYANNVVKDKKAETMQFGSIFHRSAPRQVFEYQKTYFLEGGLVMYLLLQPGKYKISVYTPKDQQYLAKIENKNEWTSNVFEYDTENPAKVLFVSPTANDNGFYNGGWHIDFKAPKYFKFTKPKM
ncbi:MAG: hypothetical protein UIB61_04170 [Treponema sp.]|jgi:hypothetical protein|nr:hypothetical protein [Treponema sp.]